MKTFSQVKELNEMKYGQPLMGNEKEEMKNLLVAACGNDQRVLNDIVNCLSEEQMKKCFNNLSKLYGYTGPVGKIVHPTM
jgi:hypothetical protein